MPTKANAIEKPVRTKLRSSILPKSNKEKSIAKAVSTLSAEEREQMIRETAYYLSERDGFQPGQEEEYWQRAEQQIDALLKV
jgi:hypothetical protein